MMSSRRRLVARAAPLGLACALAMALVPAAAHAKAPSGQTVPHRHAHHNKVAHSHPKHSHHTIAAKGGKGITQS
jgi:hypothetical protein